MIAPVKKVPELRVMLVDDQELIRSAIKAMVNAIPNVAVIAEAGSGEEAIKIARDIKPDLVLMDVKMPGIGGLEATRRLIQIDPEIKVLVVTACEGELYPKRLLQVGAAGYLTKGSKQEELARAIQMIRAGQRYISPEISNALALNNLTEKKSDPFAVLSKREIQIAIMVAHGYEATEIAEKLHISSKTANSYRYRIFIKLNLKNDVELTLLALRHGLVEVDEIKT